MKKEVDFRKDAIIKVAEVMCLAARTAPKAKGIDLLEIIILDGHDIEKLSSKMKEIGDRESHPTFLRDSENVKHAQAIVIIGTKLQTIGLRYCSFCGFANCGACEGAGSICAYNPGDLGIAVGSAVNAAANYKVDNRVMYTAGKASIEAGFFSKDVKIAFGIPLSVSSKNPFFDRK